MSQNGEANATAIVLAMYQHAAEILLKKPRREREKIDEIDVVFVDIINGKPRSHRAFGFKDILESIADGGKPVGLILECWDKPQTLAEPFPGISVDEEGLLMGELAAAQDESQELEED